MASMPELSVTKRRVYSPRNFFVSRSPPLSSETVAFVLFVFVGVDCPLVLRHLSNGLKRLGAGPASRGVICRAVSSFRAFERRNRPPEMGVEGVSGSTNFADGVTGSSSIAEGTCGASIW